MQRGLLTLMSMVAVVFGAFAQNRLEEAKYELIRETIDFLATDRVVSRDTGFRVTCETLDYECFTKQLAGEKPIDGIDRWYNTWRRMTVANEAELAGLRSQIFADILDRPGKGYRKQLAGYGAYLSRTESLINPVEATSVASYVDTVHVEEADAAPQVEQHDNPKAENSMIAYLALIIGIIALGFTLRPFLNKKPEQEEQAPTDPEDLEGLHMRLDGLAMRMKRLEDKLADAQLADALTNLTQIMESIEKRVVELEK